jgi:hydrogenase large subunit
MWRGIENILTGRDARDAWFFAQRFCGVCTTVHAISSVRAIEDALQLRIPLNAHAIRNLLLIAHALHDHIVHFYQLSALDWVDVTEIPKADPKAAAKVGQSLSDWPGNSRQALSDVQAKITGFLQGGELGPFANGYWGHPAMRLSPEVNLLATAHYLQALEAQRKANQVVAMLGSKTPHIQNLTVGGVANAINPDSMATLNLDKLYQLKAMFDDVRSFIEQVYFVDACTIAGLYPEWFSYGAGDRNYLASPDLPVDESMSEFDLPGGFVPGGDGSQVRPIETWRDRQLRESVTEDVSHAWYEGRESRHPWNGETKENYTGFDEEGKYTWVKAPRYEGGTAEVGPLSNVIVGNALGHPLTTRWTEVALDRVNGLAKQAFTVDDLQSTMGRHLSRAIRTRMLTDLFESHWERLVTNVGRGDLRIHEPPRFPKGTVEGVGFHEAPRGMLSHWAVVEKGVLKNYQAVVPTTWNASPRDGAGRVGPYEASLLGTPVAQVAKPLEVLRTVHSFDPCMACACHAHDVGGRPETLRVR